MKCQACGIVDHCGTILRGPSDTDRIKSEIAELTLLATEAVLRTKLDEGESRRLIDEALSDVDFSKLTND